MKHLKLCGIFVLGMFPVLSQAGDTRFSVEMFYGTCPVSVFVEGNVKNVVQLGTVPPGGVGETKTFTIKAIDPTNLYCKWYAATGRRALFRFTSGDLNNNGLADYNKPNNGSFVRISPANGIKSDPITFKNRDAQFTIDKINTVGFRFNTALHGGHEAGNFWGSIAYAVTYQY